MSKKNNILPIILVLLLISNLASGQYFITDTIFIDFRYDTIIPFNTTIGAIQDNRNVNPKLVSFTTKKKFLLVPVDMEVCTKNRLDESILESLSVKQKSIDSLNLEINQFIIEKFRGRFTSYYLLKADFGISTSENTGTLSYTYKFNPKAKKTPMPEICADLIEEWHREFKLDLIQTSQFYKSSDNVKPSSLIEKELERHSFFNTTVGAVLGLNFWQIEGEMYFSRPETNESGTLHAGIVRYQNTPDLEMFGFGKKSEHVHKRINDRFLFDLSTNILFGINKWKVPDDVELLQIVQISFSSNQSINFDNINESGFIVKAGLFENVYYIYKVPLKFQIGAYLSVGYKF